MIQRCRPGERSEIDNYAAAAAAADDDDDDDDKLAGTCKQGRPTSGRGAIRGADGHVHLLAFANGLAGWSGERARGVEPM